MDYGYEEMCLGTNVTLLYGEFIILNTVIITVSVE